MADEPSPSSGANRPSHPLIERLEERRERHLQRSRLYRAAVVLAGFVLILAGIVLSGPGVPGPGFLVILIGLGLLALEFAWAARTLERAVEYGERAKERAERASPWQRVLGGVVAALALGAFVAAAILYDIPLLPV